MERLFETWGQLAAAQNYPGGTDDYPTNVQEAALKRFFYPQVSRPKERLLYLGCGNGKEVAMARDFGFDAWGVTLNENNIRHAEEVLGLQNVFMFDAHLMPLEWADQFDGVFGFQFLEHSWAPIIMLVEVLRVLKPGGLAYFETPGPATWTLDANLHHITCPIDVQAHGWLMKAGFSDPHVEVLGDVTAARHLAIWGRKP